MSSTYGHDELIFNNWKIEENSIDGHIHFLKNSVQKLQIGNDGLEASDIVYSGATSGLTATDVQSALDEEENQILNQSQNVGGGGSIKLLYKFSTSTSDSNPGSGKIRLNNSTYTSVTKMFINNIENKNSIDMRNILSLATGDIYIYLQKYDDSSKYVLFEANGVDSTDSNYLKFENLNYVNGNSTLQNDKKTLIIIGKKQGSQLKNVNIPALPTTTGGIFNLRYLVDSNSFQWHQVN